jgi:hypothetical protein
MAEYKSAPYKETNRLALFPQRRLFEKNLEELLKGTL